jgi:hypothetical protein
MTQSDRRFKEAIAAISRVFSDTSVSQARTRASLQSLREEIDNLLEALPTGESSDLDSEALE